MKTTKLFSIAAAGMCLFAAFSTASAQTIETNRDENGKIVKGPYLASTIAEGWFLDLGAGPSVYLGGRVGDFGQAICPVIDLSIGKWITPEVALRLNGNYTPKYKEFLDNEQFDFYYFSIHADFMWDLLTTFGGYKTKRVYHIIPYAGAGYSHLHDMNSPSAHNEFSLHAGLINKFRLCEWADFNLELRATALRQNADDIQQSNHAAIDVPASVTAGFTFYLGKRNFRRAETYANGKVAAVTAAKDAQIAALAAEKAAALAANAALLKENAALKAAKPDTVVIDRTVALDDLPEVVMYFSIGKSELTPQEASHFETFVYYVKKTVESGQKVTLVGSCDKQTGTAAYNKKLSKKRAEEVKSILVKEYGIPADKIETVADGGTNNRFKNQVMNRCVYVRFQPQK